MTLLRMDNVSIVIEDMDATIAFFVELGLEVEARMVLEADWADRIVGLDGQRVEIAMLRTPDGHNKLELASYLKPAAVAGQPDAPVNTLGIRRLMFAVEGIDDVLARLQARGAALVGELTRIEDSWLMCYLRGPEGILVGLAERIG
ncbi:VOC family protein [Nocardia crassostreae]|uniref:VOC family protein n=1 Tax=Nocardia crassostreae TaxID=53428 RepID=UPI00082D4F2F|nr:VOC family protein [Nocardia crassostreae]